MKMSNYWEKRYEKWIANQNKTDTEFQKILEKDYQRTARELEKEIASYFARYSKEDVIEFRTLLQELSDADKSILYGDIDAFIEKYPQYSHLVPIRESIYKLNRLEGLRYSTHLKLLELGAIEQEQFERHLLETFGKQHQYLIDELGLGKQFLAVNDTIAKATIYTKWVNNQNFSDRIWNNKEKLLNHLTTTYRDGLARGDNYEKLTKAIMERFSVAYFDARRLVWTEASFIMNQAHSQAYIQAGVEEYELNAKLDSRTSKICRDMDGKRFRFDEMIVGINYPPFHSFCRTLAVGADLDKLLD